MSVRTNVQKPTSAAAWAAKTTCRRRWFHMLTNFFASTFCFVTVLLIRLYFRIWTQRKCVGDVTRRMRCNTRQRDLLELFSGESMQTVCRPIIAAIEKSVAPLTTNASLHCVSGNIFRFRLLIFASILFTLFQLRSFFPNFFLFLCYFSDWSLITIGRVYDAPFFFSFLFVKIGKVHNFEFTYEHWVISVYSEYILLLFFVGRSKKWCNIFNKSFSLNAPRTTNTPLGEKYLYSVCTNRIDGWT